MWQLLRSLSKGAVRIPLGTADVTIADANKHH